MRRVELVVVFPSSRKREELSTEGVEPSAIPSGSTLPFPKTAPSGDRVSSSLLSERVRSREGGVGVQSVNIKEGLERKCGVLGTTGEMGGTGVDGPGSSPWSRACISTSGPKGSSIGNIGTKISCLASASPSLKYSSSLVPELAAHVTIQVLTCEFDNLPSGELELNSQGCSWNACFQNNGQCSEGVQLTSSLLFADGKGLGSCEAIDTRTDGISCSAMVGFAATFSAFCASHSRFSMSLAR